MKTVSLIALISITSNMFSITPQPQTPENNPLLTALNTPQQADVQPQTVITIPPYTNHNIGHHTTTEHEQPSRDIQFIQVSCGFFAFLTISYFIGLIIQQITTQQVITG